MRMHKIDQSYTGPTRNPCGELLEVELAKFGQFGVSEARAFFASSGVTGPDAHKARAWARFNTAEKEILIQAAQLRVFSLDWDHYDEKQKERLWLAITRAATWGERVKAAIA